MQGAEPLASPRPNRKQHGLTLRNRYPAGGLPSLPPARPAFSLLSFPHPPAPLPGGKGENQGYFMQGAPPLASPRPNRKQHGLTLRNRYPAGGLPSLPPARPAFSLLSFPHPPAPLPGGKGENQGYFMQGAPPLASPGLNPRGTGEGGEPRTRRGCAFGISNSAQNRQNRLSIGSAGSQGEGGPGEMELSVASDGGV